MLTVSTGSAAEGGVTAAYVDRRIEEFQTSDESRLFLSGYGKAEFRQPIDDGPTQPPPRTSPERLRAGEARCGVARPLSGCASGPP